MKTHTRFRRGLCLGLLSLHVLSSCSHTGQQLGMGSSLRTEDQYELDELSRRSSNSSVGSYDIEGDLLMRFDSTKIDRNTTNNAGNGALRESTILNMGDDSQTPDSTVQRSGKNQSSGWTWKRKLVCGLGITAAVGLGMTATTVVGGAIVYYGVFSLGNNNLHTTTPSMPNWPITPKNNPMDLTTSTLDYLAEHHYPKDILEGLVESGELDVNAQTPGGTYLLDYALSRGDEPAWNYLKEKGVDLNKPNKAGVTPLMHAAALGRRKAFDWLIRNRADNCIKNEYGNTVEHYIGLSDKDTQAFFLEKLKAAPKCPQQTNQKKALVG